MTSYNAGQTRTSNEQKNVTKSRRIGKTEKKRNKERKNYKIVRERERERDPVMVRKTLKVPTELVRSVDLRLHKSLPKPAREREKKNGFYFVIPECVSARIVLGHIRLIMFPNNDICSVQHTRIKD